ncbi:MAG: bacteriophage holin [Gemmatimonadota bacterium]|nr:MAG: bacteriophage holin [Gemmatimonadota bacterium]
MKLSIKGLALASGIWWGGSILLVGLINLIWPSYGVAFLDFAQGIYPGYGGSAAGFGGLILGTVYGLVDGAVGGAIFAWLYNTFSGSASQGASASVA